MSDKDDGGQAFPAFTNQYDYGYEKELPATVAPGMSLRDYFAAKALQACIPACGQDSRPLNVSYSQHVSILAYEMADAMLKAREAK